MRYLIIILLLCMGVGTVHSQVADFSFDPTPSTRCAPVQVQCTDLSTGTPPTSWSWTVTGPQNFNSTDQNPGFTFIIPGVYNITLTLNNGSTSSQSVTVFRIPQVSLALAPGNPSSGCAPFTACFRDNTIPGDGPIVSWEWDLGVPPAVTVQNPCITYTQKNRFDIELVVTDANGCQAFGERVNYITVLDAPTPNFSVSPSSSCTVPLDVTVNNTTFPQVGAGYQWSFPGTGVTPSSFSGQNPGTVNYTQNGTYGITLTTSDGACTKQLTIPNAVQINTLVADFTISNTTPCQNQVITLTDNSNLSGLNYSWLANGVPVGGNTSVHNISFPNVGVQNLTLNVSTQDGLCTATITKQVNVQAGPTVDFTANNTSSCGVPFTVNFTSNSPGAASYAWTFTPSGGASPSTSTAANPSVTFTSPGSYTASLTVTSANGCTRTITKSNYIVINNNLNVSIRTTAQNNEGCAPLNIGLSVIGTLPQGVSIASVNWNIPGGSPATATGINTNTTYNTPGNYTVTATVTFTGGCAPKTISTLVKVGNRPTLTATTNPSDICLNESVTGSATSNLPGTQFSWYFEPPGGFVNGGIGTTSNVGYTYDTEWQQPWEVLLVGNNNGCKDTVTTQITVNPPAAQFTWSRACDPRTLVSFDANAAQGIFSSSVNWYVNYDFSNPIHTASQINQADFTYDFGTLDVYHVTLIVSSSFTGCTDSVTNIVDLLNSQPNAAISPRSLCPGESVSFRDQSAGIRSWQWSFGDGDTSNIATTPTTFNHVYAAQGIYDTYLFTVDNQGCADTLGPVKIYVGGGTARIGGVLGSCVPPLTTTFNANSSVFPFGVATADWIVETDPGTAFVNGSLTAGPYTYNTDGDYTVFVTVSDTIGCTDDTSVTVRIGDVEAQFVANVTDICPGQAVSFNNNSLGGNLLYEWNFGDGNTSNEQDPVHTYLLTGQYTVTLTITDTIGNCTDTEVKNTYINASGTGFDFVGSTPRSANCPPLFVSFNMVPPTTLDQVDYVKWYFEESNEIPGYEGDELVNSTSGQNFYLQGGPDGAGYYDVILVVEVGGCRDSIYKDDYIFVGGQRGSFTFTPDTVCAPDIVTFSKVDVVRTDSIFWDFGGGDVLNVSVNIDNIPVLYDEPGVYEPVILLKNQNCPPVAVDPGRKIYVSDLVARGFADRNYLCDGGPAQFSDSTIVFADSITGDFISNLLWNFGDGTTSTQSNPLHTYSGVTGDLTVTLDITTDFGCRDDTSFIFSVYETPEGQVGPAATICIGESVDLAASGANNYLWTPSQFVIDNTSSNPTVIPDDTTDFQVIMYNNILCPDTGVVRVNVIRRIDGVVGPDAEICAGESIQLEAIALVTSINGTTTYTWAPTAGLSNPNIADPIASPNSTIIYTVTIQSGSCEPDQANVLIEVGGTPFVDAGPDQVIAQGETADLLAFSPNIVTYTWFDIEGNFISNDQSISVSPPSSTTYVVEVGNEACRDIDSVDILILENCDQGRVRVPNIFTPNGDGVNDLLSVRPGLGIAEIASFKIFNRWGELVYTTDSESVRWDGTQNGEELDPGVYVYYIDLICTNGQKSIRKGNVTLLK